MHSIFKNDVGDSRCKRAPKKHYDHKEIKNHVKVNTK